MGKLGMCFKVIRKRMRRAWRRMRPAQRRLLCFSVIFLIAGCTGGIFAGKALGRNSAEKAAKAVLASTEKKLGKVQDELREANQLLKDTGVQNSDETRERLEEFKDGIPWNMTLVNNEHPMQEGYVPEVAEIEQGLTIDARVAEELNAMLAAARAEGISLHVCSAYRSVDKQTQVFNSTVEDWMNQGADYWTAYQNTCKEVALPGTSEHGLGLAVDIVDDSYTELDERQADTAAAKWLQEHCTEYGFILRYPADKESTTGIIYEAWHYRYVGKEYAQKIKDSGLTLEEYLGEAY